jgi:hypothetical protein
MQNNYQGPPDRFAMMVPVPIVLQKENVKTLPREVFDRVDQLAAPRLVEYWEQEVTRQPRPTAHCSSLRRARAGAGTGPLPDVPILEGPYNTRGLVAKLAP